MQAARAVLPDTAADQLDLFEPCPIARFYVLASNARRAPNALAPIKTRATKIIPEATNPRTVQGFRRRLSIARTVLSEGGTISEFGRRIGLGTQSASKWIRDNASDLHSEFLNQRHPMVLCPTERVARLRAIQAGQELGLSYKLIGSAIGISANRLRIWLEVWAPYGVEDALELEEVGDDEAFEAPREEEAA